MKNCKLCGALDTSLIVLTTPLSQVIINKYPIGKLSLIAISRRHVESITDLSFEESADLMQIIAMVVNYLRVKINTEGFNIFINEGAIAGQSIKHFHFHIVARNTGDGLERLNQDEPCQEISMEEIEEIRELF